MLRKRHTLICRYSFSVLRFRIISRVYLHLNFQEENIKSQDFIYIYIYTHTHTHIYIYIYSFYLKVSSVIFLFYLATDVSSQ